MLVHDRSNVLVIQPLTEARLISVTDPIRNGHEVIVEGRNLGEVSGVFIEGVEQTIESTEGSTAVAFDGVDQHITTPYRPLESHWDGGAAFEARAVLHESANTANDYCIIGLEGTPRLYIQLRSNGDGTWDVQFGFGDNWERFSGTFPGRGQIVHFAASWDGSTLTCYVDSDEIGSFACGWSGNANNDLGLALENAASEPRYLHGQLHEVRVWSVARSQEQFSDNRAAFIEGDEDGLLRAWTIEEGSGTTAIELVAGDDGTLQNGATWITGGEVTRILFTADVGDLPFGPSRIRVTAPDNVQASMRTTLQPISGSLVVSLADYPPPDGQESIFDRYDDVEEGDQIEHDTITDQEDDVEVFENGTFTIDGDGPQRFQYRLWDATDGTWSEWAWVNVNSELRTPPARRINVRGRDNVITMPA